MLILLSKKGRTVADYLLAFWFFLILLAITTIYIGHNSESALDWYFDFTDISVFLYGPIIYFYARALRNSDFKLSIEYAFHLIPFIVSGVSVLIYYSVGSGIPSTFRNLILISKMLLLLLYVIAVLLLLKKYNKEIEEFYSNTDRIKLNWLRFLAVGFIIIFTISSISQIVYAMGILEIPQYGGYFTNIVLCVFVISIGYFGIKQTAINIPQQIGDHHNEKNQEIILESNKIGSKEEKDFRNLVDYVKSEKPYLDGELTLYKLANQVNKPPYQLSKLINNYGGISFYDFINQFRIEEVKTKINNNMHVQHTLLSIGYDSGFNSKASFNRVFKKLVGMTPREYVNQIH